MHGSEVLYCHSAGEPSKMERRSAASTFVDAHEHFLCCQGNRTQHAGRPSTTAYSIQQAI